jgi:Ca2+-binding RTX toxin-like protein
MSNVVSSKKKGTGMKRLFGSFRYRVGGAALLIAMLVLVAGVGTALAAMLTGGNNNNTIIGTPNAPDSITDGTGSDIIYGLGGSTTQGNTITAGSGSDVIVGDGECTQGYDTVSAGYSAASYCEIDQGNPKEARDYVTAGSGDDVIVGGAGTNTITAGGGSNLIVGGEVGGDKITAGNGTNNIYLGRGPLYKTGSTVTVGTGSGTIHAQNGVKDTITCGGEYKVYADHVDVVHGCGQVIYKSDPSPSYNLSSIQLPHRRGAAHKATHKGKKTAGKHKRSR